MTETDPAAPATLTGATFERAFPFHLHLDAEMRVCGAGLSLRKACPSLQLGQPLLAQFHVRRPRGLVQADDWQRHLGELCTLVSRQAPTVTLRGSAERAADGSLLLLVSPVLASLDEVAELGLGFNDFAKHDSTGDSLLLAQTTRMSGLDAQRLAERLRARSDQMTTILELSQSGVVYFDPQRALLQINSALLAMLGLTRSAALELDIDGLEVWIGQRLVSARDGGGPVCPPLAQLTGGAPEVAAGLTLNLERPLPAVVHAVGARTRDGGWVFYFRDVTRETEVDRMKSEFLTTAAHELRTPMVSVFGFTELLLNRPVPEGKRRDVLETIHRQASLLINMVNELLDLARIEARQGKDMRPDLHRVGDLMQQAVDGLFVGDAIDRVRLDCPDGDVRLTVDGETIQRALTNVLSNAVKFSPPDSPIALATCRGTLDGRPALGLRVCDQGIGMSAEHARRIFERFFRADPSGHRPGTGLGMSLVKEIVDLHGGRVDVDSRPGQGTDVTLWLPLGASPEDAATALQVQ